VAKGATLRAGGKRNGPYYEPTVLTGVTHQMRLMTEETFGPVLPIATFRTEDEAVALANDNRYGLSASVWSKNGDRALALAKRLQAGSVTINETALTYGALELPFGGVKESGVGRVNGVDGLLNYTQLLPIIADRFGRAEEAVWYPYTPEKVVELRKGLKVIFGSFLRWLL
jgi:acyl-CoA reductase-like NAD-dependent aldehyde dehydrogenase